MIHTGDCVEVMRTLPDASVDAVVTDPPYGLEFMGKEWDRLGATVEHPDDGEGPWGRTARVRYGQDARTMQAWHEQWATEAFRVLKPGGYLLAFGGTRTVHRLASAIEDAGFEIRDELVWIYASGFPKSLNLTGDRQGWGTALKPAHEPIVMARKPLTGTVAQNVTRWGTGALNIDGTRIGTDGGLTRHTSSNGEHRDRWEGNTATGEVTEHGGRWPSNILLSSPELFDQPNPYVVGSGATTTTPEPYVQQTQETGDIFPLDKFGKLSTHHGDSGGYSRFFIVPKADRAEREPVLRGSVEEKGWTDGRATHIDNPRLRMSKQRENSHPTVKPVDLMRHLVRLVTPPGGTVLDPFLGSGTTAIACELEGFPWIGIEKEPEYVAIAEARLNGTQRGLGI